MKRVRRKTSAAPATPSVAPATGTAFQTVRIHKDSIPVLQEILQAVSAGGWTVIGFSRTDRVSQATIVDAGLRCLRTKLLPSGK